MKLSTLIGWVGPAAIGGGVFMVFSGLAGLPIHIPYLTREEPTGYAAVGTGLVLFALVLLLVGMAGLYAGRPGAHDARVIEYGDARARYVLTEEASPALETAGGKKGGQIARRVPPRRQGDARCHRGFRGVGGRG